MVRTTLTYMHIYKTIVYVYIYIYMGIYIYGNLYIYIGIYELESKR